MAMNTDDSFGSARFDFRMGALRGSVLTLEQGTLTYRGGSRHETVPLGAISAVRIAFERDAGKIGWAVVLLVVAWGLSAASAPLAGLADSLAGGVRGDAAASVQDIASIMIATFRGLGDAARMLPTLGNLIGAIGVALLAIGLWGRTTLTLTLSAVEREYAVWGRNRRLFDFAEVVSERVADAHG
ncbi:MAG: hypothetical protein R3357_12065 [Burkholderiales bacterium]|nr:hypothetical protein [Burkholderiales bacterium]